MSSEARADGGEVAIRAEGLSKSYQVYGTPADRLKQLLYPSFQRMVRAGVKTYHREFPALRGVSFEVRRGETVGIIGRNGSGKSTLLQLICGTLAPSAGSVETHGRIAALLELGSGFNPEFTGRENVYLNGSILGLERAEIDRRLEGILAFAGIGDYIDQPVKTYSSGMVVRLAFAVAINVDPRVLIIDEALAVGDELFQRKCYSRIEAIKNNGATILFVSHSGSVIVELCDRAILLDGGEMLAIGEPKRVVGLYQRLLYAPAEFQAELRERIRTMGADADAAEAPAAPGEARPTAEELEDDYLDPNLLPQSTLEYESKGAVISNPEIHAPSGRKVNCVSRGTTLAYRYRVRFVRDARNVRFGMLIKSISGLELGGAVSASSLGESIAYIPAGAEATAQFTFRCNLNPGTYFLNSGVTGADGAEETYLHRVLDICMFKVLPVKGDRATAFVDFGSSSTVAIAGGRTEERA